MKCVQVLVVYVSIFNARGFENKKNQFRIRLKIVFLEHWYELSKAVKIGTIT